MSKESFRRAVAFAETTGLWRPEIEGEENLFLAAEQLKKGSVVAIANHPFKGDLIYPLVTCLRFLGGNIQHLIMPADQSQVDLLKTLKTFCHLVEQNRNGPWELLGNYFAFRIGAKLIDIEMIPVVKGVDVYYYGWKTARRSWENFLDRAGTALQESGTLIIIFPEGERSQDGNLQSIKRGVIDLLERGGNNCLCLPLGVNLEGQRRGLNVRQKVVVQAGPLFGLGDLISEKPPRMNCQQKKEAARRLMEDHLAPLISS